MTDAIDITPEQRKTLLALIRRYVPQVEVWAYGSRVKWTSHPASDLDLIVFTAPEQRRQFSELKDAIAESNLPFTVGVHVWGEEPERFQKIVRKNYVVLQAAGEQSTPNKAGWPFVRLGNVCWKIGSGATPRGGSETYLESGSFSLIRSQNVYNNRFTNDGLAFISKEQADDLSNVEVSAGDVLLNITGDSVARCCQAPKEVLPARVNQHVAIIRPDPDELNPTFLRYFLVSPQMQEQMLTLAGAGATRNALTKGMIESFDVPKPDITEQRAIASVLGSLDDKIELNRRMNETLEALAQSLFKSWFVDATQSALPKGWHYATIAELCKINSWTLGKGDELDQIEYVEISEVMRGNIINIQSYKRGQEPSRARRRLRHGDTVLSTVRPDRGAYFLCLNPSPSLIGSTGFAVLTPTKAPWSFIHAAVTQPDVFEYLGQQADGGAYPAVRPEIIGALEVPWPSKTELVEEYHRACAPLYERAELNRQESRTLAALRDALLPKLLSGELRVPAATTNCVEATT